MRQSREPPVGPIHATPERIGYTHRVGRKSGRLIRQTLTETLLLGIAGGAAGCVLAWGLVRLFVGIAPNGIPRLEQAAIDARVLWFTLVASLLSGLVFGLAPAIQRARWRVNTTPRMLLRESLVTAQIAVSLVLLTAAGMLLRSLWKVENVPLGIEAEHVVIADFTLGRQRYSPDARQLEFFNELETRMAGIPGATAVAISDSLPPSGGTRGRPLAALQLEGQPPRTEGSGGPVVWRYVSPGYFAALGIPIRRGRGFQAEDRAPGEASIVLSELLARRLFPAGDALGSRIHIDTWFTVVGVAADVRNAGPLKPADPEYYVLRKSTPDEVWRNQMQATMGWRHAYAAIRTPLNAALMADWMKKEFAALDPSLPVATTTMEQKVSVLAQRPRFNAILLSLFAAMGVLLAVIGLYGVMAFLVGQRTQEIGVRMALGATPGTITKLILGRAMRWTVSGAVLGLIGSFFATKTLRSMLFEVSERDPWTIGVVLPALFLIALAAAPGFHPGGQLAWIRSLRCGTNEDSSSTTSRALALQVFMTVTKAGSWALFWRSVVRFQADKVNPWIAVRNTLGLAVPLAVATALGQVPAGLAMSTGALNVSFRDSASPYIQRARMMLAASLIAGSGVFAGGISGRNNLIALLVAGVWAFGAGMLVALSTAAADLGVLSLVLVLVYSSSQQAGEHPVYAGMLAFAGGLIQTLLAVLFWPLRRYVPERRALSDLYMALAQAAKVPIQATEAPPASPQSTAAQTALAALDRDDSLEGIRYRSLLTQAERMRVSLLALSRIRNRMEREIPGSHEAGILNRYFDACSRVLRAIGTTIVADKLEARERSPRAGGPGSKSRREERSSLSNVRPGGAASRGSRSGGAYNPAGAETFEKGEEARPLRLRFGGKSPRCARI